MLNIPPNPLPCGCCVKAWQDLKNARETGHCLVVPWKDHHVVLCPLHAAAPKLLAACKMVLAVEEKEGVHFGPDGWALHNEIVYAIAAAEKPHA